MKRRRNSLYLYLILNVLVSAATTLTVLVIWDRIKGNEPAPSATLIAGEAPKARPPDPTSAPFLPTETNPPPDQPVIKILSVVGIDDLNYEVVMLKRVGEGNLRMAGWQLRGEHNNTYTFPETSQLVLYKDGAVQVFSKAGEDTATDVYWSRSEPAWRSGETILLLDNEGSERARYTVP